MTPELVAALRQVAESEKVVALSPSAVLALLTAIEERDTLRAALLEISVPKGAYSLDPLTHAHNVIEDMKQTALSALTPSEATP